MKVRRRRFHPAQREVALLAQVEPGREPDVERPTGSPPSRAAPAPARARGEASHSSRAAVRRLVAASRAGVPSAVEVGVAAPGRVSDTSSRHMPQQQRVVGPVRGAAGGAGRGSPSARSRRRCRRAPSRRPGSRTGRRCPVRYICGCSVEPGLRGRAGPPSRPPRPRASRAGSRGRGAAPRRAAACRCPGPAARAARRTSPGIHISSRRNDVAQPDHPGRRPRPPSSRRGRCRTQVQGALDPHLARAASASAAAGRVRRRGAAGCRARRSPRR